MLSLSWLGESQAQTAICGPRASILEQLATKYKEIPVSFGTNENRVLIELFSSERGETWTITLTNSNGDTCLIASGENWRQHRLPVFPTDPGEKT